MTTLVAVFARARGREQHLDVSHEVYKQRLDSSGQAVAVPEREHDLHSNKTAIKEALGVSELLLHNMLNNVQ